MEWAVAWTLLDLPKRDLSCKLLFARGCAAASCSYVDKSARLLLNPQTSQRGKARRPDCFVFEGVALTGVLSLGAKQVVFALHIPAT